MRDYIVANFTELCPILHELEKGISSWFILITELKTSILLIIVIIIVFRSPILKSTEETRINFYKSMYAYGFF